MRIVLLLGSLLFLTMRAAAQQAAPPSPVLPVPSPEQLAWHAMEMNAFIHFTINTFTDKEWGYGDEDPALFDPSETNPAQWVSVLKDAGFKGVILTCKHHDGFCLWPSAHTTHDIASSPYRNGKGDLVAEVSAACRDAGLKFGVYLSPWDRNHALYGTPAYVEYYRNQLAEIFRQYGPVFEMWFDGANGGDGFYGGARERRRIDGTTYYDWPRTLELVRSFEPGVIFFSDAGPGVRWVGNEKGIAGVTNWNPITPDTLYAGKPGINKILETGSEHGTHWIPAETDVSIRPGWFYHASEDSLVKSPRELFDIYLSSVGRGSLLLLNVPPDRRGLLHENDVSSLRGWRKLMDEAFAVNHASASRVSASNVRGRDRRFAAAMAVDNKPDTYWATDDGVTSATLRIDFGAEKEVRYISIQEHIALGQRIRSFEVEVLRGKVWERVATGTTVGYKRILAVTPVRTKAVRIVIRDSRACPLISELAVY